MAGSVSRPVYEYGDWEVDLAGRELRSCGKRVPLGDRAFGIIEILVESAGALVTKQQIINHVWPKATVEAHTLQVHVSAVRKALGADRDLLQTASGHGYRLVGNWETNQNGSTTSPSVSVAVSTARQGPQSTSSLATSALIGRAASLATLQEVLSSYRTVTLIGPGGIGKSALSRGLSDLSTPPRKGHQVFIELALLQNAKLLPSVVARGLGLKLGDDEITPDSVATAINGRSLFIVLDNCEHVIDAAAQFAEAIVRNCPLTTILATSREALRIEGEYVYRVPPLDVPPEHAANDDNILAHSAVQLFTSRVRALNSAYLPSSEELSKIAAICRSLDGIPLAIEFAAARAATLGAHQVESHLKDRFTLLVGGRRTALPRQQTLRATLDWSYDLLRESERWGLCFFAILVEPFSIETAEKLFATEKTTPGTLDLVHSLVAKSLIVAESRGGETKYRLLETIRSYGLAKLNEGGQLDHVSRQHARYCLDVLERTELDWQGAAKADARPALESLLGDVRSAIDWAFAPTGDPKLGISLVAASAAHFMHLSLVNECRQHVSRAIGVLRSSTTHDPYGEMRLLTAQGMASLSATSEGPETRKIFARALAIADQLNDEDYRVRALWGLCTTCFNDGDFLAATDMARRFHDAATASGDPRAMISGDLLLGGVLFVVGNHAAARGHIERLVAREDLPVPRRVLGLGLLGAILWHHGQLDRSKHCLEESIQAAVQSNQVLALCTTLTNYVCMTFLGRGELDDADRALKILVEYATKYELTYWLTWSTCFQGALLTERGELKRGLVLMGSVFEKVSKVADHPRFTGLRGLYAEALAQAGRLEEALQIVDQTLDMIRPKGQLYVLPELLRIKSEILRRRDDPVSLSKARELLDEGLDLARKQGSFRAQIRLAASLAKLKQSDVAHAAAVNELAQIYGRFSDGFETADLRSARTVLGAEKNSKH
jgi:predicted ATPase/DNA-binding winged helix-turn-helix (wHTH) protein